MSHAREIKEKRELQAKLRLALGNTQSLVSTWLKPAPTDLNKTSIDDDPTKDEFFNLPIIGGNSGLSFNDTISQNSADISTIGDYVKTGKSLSSLNKHKKPNNDIVPNRVNKSSSKALQALQNKMRKQQNIRQRKTYENEPRKPFNTAVKRINSSQREDEDDSDEELVQKSTKKNFSLLIDTKIKKRK